MMSMYSLYRAWLLRDTASIASPSLSLPPDLILTVPTPGPVPYQFIAHRSLVASHSGYLKTAIAQEEEYGKTRPLGALLSNGINGFGGSELLNGTSEQGLAGFSEAISTGFPPQGVLEVSLPSTIQADTFSPLLTFMYTGYLDLNLSNIYELLLAVNILQMPHALDLCRSYLLHNVHSMASLTFSSAVAKPIPGRGVPPHMNNTAPPQEVKLPNKANPERRKSQPAPQQTTAQLLPPLPSYVKRNGANSRRRRKVKVISATNSHDSDSSDDVTVVTTERGRPVQQVSGASSAGHTILDIASCDGPVHFTRVLNENYDLYRGRPSPSEVTAGEESEPEINIVETSSADEAENDENRARHLETQHSFQVNFRNQIAERRNRDSSETLPAAEKLKASVQAAQGPPGTTGRNQRRVIPRTVLKPVLPLTTPATLDSTTPRHVRLLDMNVQYYPCKTCGAKFPSYYFVHKHRRRVHPEEENQGPPGDPVDPPTGGPYITSGAI